MTTFPGGVYVCRCTSLLGILISVLISIVYGFRIVEENPLIGHKCIGFGIAGLFFLWMPTFIYHRWKDRKVKDYMLTDESFQRMKDYNDSKEK